MDSLVDTAARALYDLTMPIINKAWAQAVEAECTIQPVLRPWDAVHSGIEDSLPDHQVKLRYNEQTLSLNVAAKAYEFSWEVAYNGRFYRNENDEEGLSLHSMPPQQLSFSATELEPDGMKLAVGRFRHALRALA